MSSGRIGIKIRKEVWLAVLLIIAGIAVVFRIKRETPAVSRAELPEQVEKTVWPRSVQPTKQFKVLHVMSYHSPWKWTDDQFNGFKDVLRDLEIDYKVFQMDTKRNSSEQWLKKVSEEV